MLQHDHAETTSLNHEFLDIGANLVSIQVHCWPQPESRGRRWGQYKQADAAIFPFQMRAIPSAGLNVTKFNLDVVFAMASERQSISTNLAAGSRICDCGRVSKHLYLLNVPSPENLSYPSDSARDERHLGSKPWTFSSQPHTDPSTGWARAVSWSWKGKDSCSRSLHGAVPLRHPHEAFYIACRAEGQAGSGWFKYRYEHNHLDEIKWWKLTPQTEDKLTESNFKQHMAQLDTEMTTLNTHGRLG